MTRQLYDKWALSKAHKLNDRCGGVLDIKLARSGVVINSKILLAKKIQKFRPIGKDISYNLRMKKYKMQDLADALLSDNVMEYFEGLEYEEGGSGFKYKEEH